MTLLSSVSSKGDDEMKTLGLTEGDLVFKNGDFIITEGVEEVQQCLEIMLSTNLGEWFLNRDFGFDRSLIQDKPSDDEVQAEISRVLQQEERVEVINSIEVNQDRKQRKLSAAFDVAIVGGETIRSEVKF